MRVEPVGRAEFPAVEAVWEASVRATHDFLREEDIAFLKPLISGFLAAVELRCVRDSEGGILGFCGVAGNNLEMLFVAPQSRGQGIGTALCLYAINELGVTAVDVNEQNPQALGFYQHIGFRVVGRSPLDEQGNPFPLLHMHLAGAGTAAS